MFLKSMQLITHYSLKVPENKYAKTENMQETII